MPILPYILILVTSRRVLSLCLGLAGSGRSRGVVTVRNCSARAMTILPVPA
jgi:hypothetical protein